MEGDFDVVDEIPRLIDNWCGRRELRALALLLPAWHFNTGLTDGWGDVLDALKDVRSARLLPDEEGRVVDLAIVAVEKADYRA